MEKIVNKVAQSGLITIDLEEFFPQEEIVIIDIAPQLFQGLILKENDFRKYLQEEMWEAYSGKRVAIICSADAIVPTWAYVLLSIQLEPFARQIFFGNHEQLIMAHYIQKVSEIDPANYADCRVVIKGCSKHPVPVSAYVDLAVKLRPVVKSLMYGEPCSTVPLYKRKSQVD
jgi:hypothetical protein